MTSDLTLPDAKLLSSLAFGMIRSAYSIVSHSARSVKSDGETIHVAEHRLTDRLPACDFSKILPKLEATAVRVSHQDFGDAWLICKYFPNEAEARCYLTSIDCSTREGCEKALKCYRLRWRIEELFRFVKWAFGIEDIRVRTIRGQNALLTAAMVATFFLCLPIESESPLYRARKRAWPSFKPEASDEDIERKYGHLPIGLYHVMGGASVIASHLRGEPKLLRKGRKKKEHGYEQLKLF